MRTGSAEPHQGEAGHLRVVRVAHHAVVSAWRAREREMRRSGVDVQLFSATRWNEGGSAVELVHGGDGFTHRVRTFGSHPALFVYDPFPLWRALGHCPDLIDMHEEPFALATAEILLLRALRRVRAPYVLYSAQNIDKRYPIPFRWFETWALRGADGAYVCNVEAGRILERKGLRTPATLIPLGVDVALFRPADREEPGEEPIIGFVGRLEEHKGVDVLLRAAALRPSWRVRISGEGPARGDLESLVRELGLTERVRFLGFADAEGLARRYRELDVLAVPSRPTPSWLEQFCRVAVEAMASGVPVVASRSGAIPDVVDDAGVLVDPDAPAALADGIDSALQRWSDLRARGLARAPDFEWREVARQHAKLYRTAVASRMSGARRPPQVVVVAYGPSEMLEGALDALEGRYPVTVVDNSSLESTRAAVESRGGRYIDAGRNVGFGAGVNIALDSLAERGLAGDDVLLLNPDARIGPDGVDAMHSRMHESPQIAVVGATQSEPDGTAVRVWWPFPSPARAWVESVGLGTLNRAHGFVIGSILMLRSEAITAVGRFDERFFLYAEEVDWQKRAVDDGWRVEVAPVVATHIGGGTSSDDDLRERLFHASAQAYQRKHFGAAGWRVYQSAVIVGSLVRALVLPRERGRAAARRLRRYIGFRGPV